MSHMLRPNIILLKDGTDTSQGVPQTISNINACQAVIEIVKTTLGPRGTDKLIVSDSGQTTITNDGATVIERLNIEHPAAQILQQISKAQDNEMGDGTTSVCILVGGMLSHAKQFLEDGVHPQIIIQGYRKSSQLAVLRLDEIAIDISKNTESERNQMLQRCAETTLNSKLVASYRTFFAKIAVEACSLLDKDLSLDMVGIKHISGASVTDSELIQGVAFKKTFSYAGFEQQPKSFENPKILLLNLELELKAEKDNAEARLTNPEDYQKIVDSEWDIIYEKLDLIVQSGAQVVLSKLPIGDLATQYFAQRNVFCAGRVSDPDLERTAKSTGAKIQTTVLGLQPNCLGTCGKFEEVQLGAERYNIFRECSSAKSATVLLRGGASQFLEETERSLHDAIMIVRQQMKQTRIVGGAGAVDMELSRYLREHARTIAGKQQLVELAFAESLESIPKALAQNSGGDVTEILNRLRQLHVDEENLWYGVDCYRCDVFNAYENYVWEPMGTKKSALLAATEAACLILSIDETVKNAKSQNPNQNNPGGGPM